MEIWVIISSVILAILLIVLLILSSRTAGNNQQRSKGKIIYPFTSNIDPETGKDTGFLTRDGKPQLTCPAGTKINIIGAFFDIFDPYGECTADQTDVNPLYAFMCIPSLNSDASCKQDSDCPEPSSGRFRCNSNKCELAPMKSSEDCKKFGSNFAPVTSDNKTYCVDADLCGTNISGVASNTTGVPNPVCSPNNNNYQCAMRDASATVATKCDGKETCSDLSISDFGDFPCTFKNQIQKCITGYDGTGAPQWSLNPRTDYCALPYIPGYAGGVPPDSNTNNPADPSTNLGYKLHGIYTCI